MLKRIDPFIISEKDSELMEIASWVWNSHSWIEDYPGYFTCKWCGKNTTSMIGIAYATEKLCIENPKVKEFLTEFLREENNE